MTVWTVPVSMTLRLPTSIRALVNHDFHYFGISAELGTTFTVIGCVHWRGKQDEDRAEIELFPQLQQISSAHVRKTTYVVNKT